MNGQLAEIYSSSSEEEGDAPLVRRIVSDGEKSQDNEIGRAKKKEVLLVNQVFTDSDSGSDGAEARVAMKKKKSKESSLMADAEDDNSLLKDKAEIDLATEGRKQLAAASPPPSPEAASADVKVESVEDSSALGNNEKVRVDSGTDSNAEDVKLTEPAPELPAKGAASTPRRKKAAAAKNKAQDKRSRLEIDVVGTEDVENADPSIEIKPELKEDVGDPVYIDHCYCLPKPEEPEPPAKKKREYKRKPKQERSFRELTALFDSAHQTAPKPRKSAKADASGFSLRTDEEEEEILYKCLKTGKCGGIGVMSMIGKHSQDGNYNGGFLFRPGQVSTPKMCSI